MTRVPSHLRVWLAFSLTLCLAAAIWVVITLANQAQNAELWRCVSLIAEQPPETDMAEALERCRVMLARKEVRP